jgi:hypothetical protein
MFVIERPGKGAMHVGGMGMYYTRAGVVGKAGIGPFGLVWVRRLWRLRFDPSFVVKNSWIWAQLGPDIYYGAGWSFRALLLPRPDLMGPDEGHTLVLSALAFDVRLRGWRLSASMLSDAGEISTRIAQRCGQLP